MAITAEATVSYKGAERSRLVAEGSLALTGTYVTGGFAVTPGPLSEGYITNLSRLVLESIVVPDESTDPAVDVLFVPLYNRATGKVMIFAPRTRLEFHDLAGGTALAYNAGSIAADFQDADVAFTQSGFFNSIEVPNGATLTGLSIPYEIFGTQLPTS